MVLGPKEENTQRDVVIFFFLELKLKNTKRNEFKIPEVVERMA